MLCGSILIMFCPCPLISGHEKGVGVVDNWLDMWCDNDRVLGEVVVGVKWRLREKCEFWESTLQASDTIISIIKQGYVLPLTVVQG